MLPHHRTATLRRALAGVTLLASAAACARTSIQPSSPSLAAAPAGTTTGAFVVRLGNDTMVVERYVRSADRLEAWSVNRQPATVSRHYVVTFDASGTPVRMDYDGARADGSQPKTNATLEFGADTTIVTVIRDTTRQVLRIPAGHVIPALGNSFALTELAIARFLATGKDSATIPTLGLGQPQALAQSIKRTGPNTLAFDYFGAPWTVTVDANGRITSVDGSATASKVLVSRVKDIDVAALAQDYVARDKAGRGFGIASPADSVRATIGEAKLAVNYSSPARRGRTLLGGIIPFDSVWRTGANAATMFTTSATLDIGGTTVPAGSYTLWTLPTRTGWQLVVNKQVGQWGTVYDAQQDFARIPMTVNRASASPEHFHIAIEPTGATTGTLRLTWGDIDVSVPVTVKAQSAAR